MGGLAAPKNPEGGGTGWLVGPVDPTSLKGEAWVWGQWSCFPSESSKGGTGPGGGGGRLVVRPPSHGRGCQTWWRA